MFSRKQSPKSSVLFNTYEVWHTWGGSGLTKTFGDRAQYLSTQDYLEDIHENSTCNLYDVRQKLFNFGDVPIVDSRFKRDWMNLANV